MVFISSKSTLCVVQTATVTAMDIISNIGGTLGLFTGVSLLSAVEIFYWASEALAKKWGDYNTAKKSVTTVKVVKS